MNQQTTNRKAVEDLTVGEHITDNTGIHQLVHRLPYSNGDGSPMHALTLRPLGKGEPRVARYAQGVLLHLATDGDIREHEAVGRRAEVANTLRKLADDIVAQALPVPRYSFTVGGCLGSRGELEQWVEHLGVEIRMSGDIPVADKETGGLTVHFQSDPEPAAPKPLQVDNAIAAAEALEAKPTGAQAECGCLFFQDPLKDDPTVIHDTACQNWWFTFGSGHTHPDSPAINAEGGESLADRYVVIRGTYESARTIMLRFFGRVWCDQYETAEKAGVERFGLTELHRRHWPAPAAEVTATDAQTGR